MSNLGRKTETTLLATAMMDVVAVDGTRKLMRALIDQGSQISMITEEGAQLLGLPRQRVQAGITGLGDGAPTVSKWKIQATVTPRFPSKFCMNVECYILPMITQRIPQAPLQEVDFKSWRNTNLADPTFHQPGDIDMLIGATEFGRIIKVGLRKTEQGLIGQNTDLGWILSGNVCNSEPRKKEMTCSISRLEKDKQVTKFWKRKVSKDEPLSRQKEEMQHESRKKTTTNDQRRDGIRHQPVITKESDTTKLKMELDESCRTAASVSVNGSIHVGPRLQHDIVERPLKWSKGATEGTVDAEKTDTQIHIHLQTQSHLETWQVVSTLQQPAEDERYQIAKVRIVAREEFHVIEASSSASTEEAEVVLLQELPTEVKEEAAVIEKETEKEEDLEQAEGVTWDADSRQGCSHRLTLPRAAPSCDGFNATYATTRGWILTFVAALLLVTTIPNATGSYEIHQPTTGLYVEEVGHAYIERGIFRINLSIQKEQLRHEVERVQAVIQDFKGFCNRSEAVDTPCSTFTNHLQEEETKIQQIGMSINQGRWRRGLHGLTSIFGVNDEVYHDINVLNTNQKELIKAAHQQSSIMLSAIGQINSTEARITMKLEKFRQKLNQGIKMVNEMAEWYSGINLNTYTIHVLTAYQLASAYVKEVQEHLQNIAELQAGQGSLFNLMDFANIASLITEANQKLPDHLRIMMAPLVKTTTEQDSEVITISGFFLIRGTAAFEIIRATAVPQLLANQTYRIADIDDGIMATDYNNQVYFQMTINEFKECLSTKPHEYICAPDIIKKIDTNPCCVLDHIYNRPNPVQCSAQLRKLPASTWKQLYTPNTWMYLPTKPTPVAVTCGGNRKDIVINSTSIIRISSDCVITTSHHVIAPQRTDSRTVKASYVTNVDLQTTTYTKRQQQDLTSDDERVLQLSDTLDAISTSEHRLADQVNATTWMGIPSKHIAINGAVTLVIMIAAVSIVALSNKMRKARRHRPQEPADPPQMMEMQPLNI